MASRMEKYHSNTSTVGRRSIKNEGLYRDIYENTRYSNISNVATIEKTNEISLDQIQELLKEREDKNKKNPAIKKVVPAVSKTSVDNRNYDIRDILIKAKDEHVSDNRNRSLKNTQYNILKGYNIVDRINQKDTDNFEKTLVNTRVLKNYDDNELSLDMLSDLKSSGSTMIENTNLVREVQARKDNYVPTDDDGLDKSFCTSSLSFNDDDYDQLKDMHDSIKNNNIMIKILFFILFVIICFIIFFLIYKIL